MYNVNPMQLIQMIKSGNNPQQLLMSVLEKQNNPMMKNLLSLAQEGKGNELEAIARNIAKERGIDFDKEFSSFKQMLGVDK